MQTVFSPDSKIMLFMSRIADLMILNVLFLICCIPVVTIGAASAALYTVCFQLVTEREQGIVRGFFRAFRENFKQGTVVWLIFLVCGAASATNTLLFYSLEGILHYSCVLFAMLLILVVLAYGYVFPLMSRFSNDNRSTIKNAFFLSLGHLPRSIAIAALNVLPFALLLTNLYVFLQVGFVWVVIYFAAAAYCNALLLKKVFAPYLNETEEAASC